MECKECKYYDHEDERCMAFTCYGLECAPLPCEEGAETVGYIRLVRMDDGEDTNTKAGKGKRP